MHMLAHSCNRHTLQLISHVAKSTHAVSPFTCSPYSADPTVPLHLSECNTTAAVTSTLLGDCSTMWFHAALSTFSPGLSTSRPVLAIYLLRCQDPASVCSVFQFPNTSTCSWYHQTSESRPCSIRPFCDPASQSVLLWDGVDNAINLSRAHPICVVPGLIMHCVMSLVLYLSMALNSLTVTLNLIDMYRRTEVHATQPLTTPNLLSEDRTHIHPHNCNIILTTSDHLWDC